MIAAIIAAVAVRFFGWIFGQHSTSQSCSSIPSPCCTCLLLVTVVQLLPVVWCSRRTGLPAFVTSFLNAVAFFPCCRSCSLHPNFIEMQLVPFGLPLSRTVSLSNEGTTPARFYFVALRCTHTHMSALLSPPFAAAASCLAGYSGAAAAGAMVVAPCRRSTSF
jgi:hypothetical protein